MRLSLLENHHTLRMISYYCRILQLAPTTSATAIDEVPTTATMDDSFATGRYSKRKRTQVNYYMSELDITDDEGEYDVVEVKVRCTLAVARYALIPHRSVKL